MSNEAGKPGDRLVELPALFKGYESIEDLQALYTDGTPDLEDVPAAAHWPSVPAADAETEWRELRDWVDQLQRRFEHLDHHVVPSCWWRHNQHVEALVALRDHERVSFSTTAPASAPLDWFRALRDIATLLRIWTGELPCRSAHQETPAPLPAVDEEEWDRHIEADVARRHQTAVDTSCDD